jgi:hypothetical protein
MPKHKRIWNKNIFEQRLNEGRGSGMGVDYLPWIRIQDFSSQGVVSRVKGRTTGRVHHLMSNNELAYFYVLDWSNEVKDIREQFPLLDLELAVKCAKQAGVKYPVDKVSGYPYVLTCDFMITTQSGIKARTIKTTAELSKLRVLEKLEIERRYWRELGVDWKIVTENEIPFLKAKNIEWLYAANAFTLSEELMLAANTMKRLILAKSNPISDMALIVESEFGLPSGMGLLLFKWLAINGFIEFDVGKELKINRKEVAL